MIRALWVGILRFMHLFVHKTRIYRLWSTVYRFIYHRKYNDVLLPHDMTPLYATQTMSRLIWQPDTWKELKDSVGSPQWVQHCINKKILIGQQPPGSLDCDDFAIWAANVISPVYCPYYFTLGWLKKDSYRVKGHAVCVFYEGNKIYHTGNWKICGPYDSLEELCKDICNMGGGDKVIGWSAYTKELKLLKCKKGLPRAR